MEEVEVTFGEVIFEAGLVIISEEMIVEVEKEEGRDCDSCRTVVDGRAFLLLCEGVSSDNMGSKEFSVGIFSFKEGTNLIKFPTVEQVREVFLLYHMKIIPKAIVHMPVSINKANMSLGANENGKSSSIFSRTLSNKSIDMVGNFKHFSL